MVINKKCSIFIILKYKETSIIIAMLIKDKVTDLFCIIGDLYNFLMQ